MKFCWDCLAILDEIFINKTLHGFKMDHTNKNIKQCIINEISLLNTFVHGHKSGAACSHVLYKNSDIYFWNGSGYSVVVKCIPLTRLAVLPCNFMKVEKLDRYDAEPFMEIKMLTQVNKMKSVCPHFVDLYHWTLHDHHIYRNSNINVRDFSKTSVVLYLQKMDMDCYEWSKKTLPNTLMCKNMMFQILFALSSIHKNIQFVHGDAHVGNVLCMKQKSNQGAMYVVSNTLFTLPSSEYQWYLSDFGRSRSICSISCNNDPAWADTPRLEYVNFLHSVQKHVAKADKLKCEISLILEFIRSGGSMVNIGVIFASLFPEFVAVPNEFQKSAAVYSI